jgi:alanyl-tRNA synthetase
MMKKLSSNEIRSTFLRYFRDRGHEIVPSSPLVPANDPTLLFTNAGMVQFKDVFLGADKRPYKRAVTSQRCVRAGGKHNDLENVGYTARHHTFCEMLGNFSFGDYFKQVAIQYCWELLTEVYGLPAERLWVTVFEEDQEAEDIWKKDIGVDPKRFSRCGLKDNFWSMGDTGPCGPCSEVFYDHGPEVEGGPPGSPDEDGDRYIEIWNLVFMQFNRDAGGTMTPLPKPSVDTGMGLERLAAVLQGVHSNYETDLFTALIERAAEITDAKDLHDKSLRVIADHIRSCAFLVVDGVVPSNEGRGYVLRRIIRRAIRHGHKLGISEPFFYLLVESLEAQMGQAYPELAERRPMVERILKQEEERFSETLDQGMRILDEAIENLSAKEIPGETVFMLYDTFGFPVDLTADIARERGLSVDMTGFKEAMEGQRKRARAASQFEVSGDKGLTVEGCSEFIGYDHLQKESKVIALLSEGEQVESLGPEDRGMVVLESTPFYSEGGGQVGDRGELSSNGARFEVEDTQRRGEAVVHYGVMTDGEIRVGDKLLARVDRQRRRAIARNHSATHLLHAALREVLGKHVMQKGSLVAPDRLRFDFSHYEPVGKEQLSRIEDLVNHWVLQNDDAVTRVMALDKARESGAIALFGEKYDDPVRVLSFGEYSTELCGGTHVAKTGDVGLFKLTSETGVAAGVRRVEAVTGEGALHWVRDLEDRIGGVASMLKSDRDSVMEKVGQLLQRTRELERELNQMKARLAASHGEDLAAQAEDVDGLKVLAAKLDGVDPKRLRETVDRLKNKLGSAAIVLATVQGDKVSLVAGVTDDYVDRIAAGPLANFVAQQVGGRGGGRPDMAQAGGNDPSKIDQAIRSVPNWIKERLSA